MDVLEPLELESVELLLGVVDVAPDEDDVAGVADVLVEVSDDVLAGVVLIESVLLRVVSRLQPVPRESSATSAETAPSLSVIFFMIYFLPFWFSNRSGANQAPRLRRGTAVGVSAANSRYFSPAKRKRADPRNGGGCVGDYATGDSGGLGRASPATR